jgi:hypothetical protein
LKKRVGLSEATVQEFKALNYCAINLFGYGINSSIRATDKAKKAKQHYLRRKKLNFEHKN